MNALRRPVISDMLALVPAETDRSERSGFPAPETREDLLARVARGDQGAFAELYDQTSSRVLGLVQRVLVDHAQSEEVTQEVFLEIWQAAPRYSADRGSAITWILTLAHRRAVDRVRASESSRQRDLRIGVRDHVDGYDEVAEQVEIRLENVRVERALSRLSDAQREAVTLAYYGGLTQSEVSDRLGIPLGTVKTRLRDGMIRLRNELGVTA
jgi:RNA polymerase sigma-70 factor (ECF subfamily)